MNSLELLIDLHLPNHRQGPGSDDQTRRAIELANLDRNAELRIADIGCGTGASTLVLASELNARITAIDAASRFIRRLEERVTSEGVASRIDAHVGDMNALPFEDAQLDVIWSEGAIYNMGFERGVNEWRKYLRPGGLLVVSELTWTTASRPEQINAYWTREYPAITTASENLKILERAGYAPHAMFFLPRDCWSLHYDEPRSKGFDAFLQRHAGCEDAQRIVQAEVEEINVRKQHAAWYDYAFYISQRQDPSV